MSLDDEACVAKVWLICENPCVCETVVELC